MRPAKIIIRRIKNTNLILICNKAHWRGNHPTLIMLLKVTQSLSNTIIIMPTKSIGRISTSITHSNSTTKTMYIKVRKTRRLNNLQIKER